VSTDLHQIEFGMRTGRGLGVVAASHDDPETVDRWSAALDRHIRLLRFRGRPAPGSALSFLRLSAAETAVLWRWSEPGAVGRNGSRALIGPVELLTAATALGLADWRPLGRPEGGHLPLVGFDEVLEAGRRGASSVAEESGSGEEIVAVLAALLDAPTAPVSVLGGGDRRGVVLVGAVRAIAHDYLALHGVRRDWTFSTYAVDHGDDDPRALR
jgi:hypothetical protein